MGLSTEIWAGLRETNEIMVKVSRLPGSPALEGQGAESRFQGPERVLWARSTNLSGSHRGSVIIPTQFRPLNPASVTRQDLPLFPGPRVRWGKMEMELGGANRRTHNTILYFKEEKRKLKI